MIDKQTLLAAAKEARQAAYAPYSRFLVGAAVVAEDGNVYTGCNIENASYGETCCAERVAIFKAISNGVTRFSALAVVGGRENEPTDTPCMPCGACRQVMAEFCKEDMPIYTNGKETTVGALLPDAFQWKG